MSKVDYIMLNPDIPKKGSSRMAASRVFRFIEGSLIVLFLIQGARIAFGLLLSSIDRFIPTGQVDPVLAGAHLALIAALILPWFTARTRTVLPRFLLLAALGASLARFAMSLPVQVIQLFAALATIGAGSVYLASLLRANRKTWVTSIVVGLVIEQLLRALNSYDITIQASTNVPVSDFRLQMPVYAIQAVLSLFAIAVSIAARRNARIEPY